MGSDLALLSGDFSKELLALAQRTHANALFYNEDYEPDAIVRDEHVRTVLERNDIAVHSHVDHVYFAADQILNSDGAPYQVFTSYKRQWLDLRAAAPLRIIPSFETLSGKLLPASEIVRTVQDPSPEEFGFARLSTYPRASENIANDSLAKFIRRGGPVERYQHDRDYPSISGTSHLSPQLRAGTIGIRTCIDAAFRRREESSGKVKASIDSWISECIWRDFYQMILKQFPHVATRAFKRESDRIPWRDAENDFLAWCEGRTGYPLVDAAMRQLNTYGWMHNRLRMLVASFLTKHLLIDWRRGERYFETHLADADLAANNGGWQWAASTGTDSVPYFRIFNPVLQSQRFDPEGAFIRKMVPELALVPGKAIHAPWKLPPVLQADIGVRIGVDYPSPIVEHTAARKRALSAFAG